MSREDLADDAGHRRRRLLYRAWRRGTREMDLILGRFAAAELASLDNGELDAFEALMDLPDTELYQWVSGALPPPGPVDTPFFARLRAFNTSSGRVDG